MSVLQCETIQCFDSGDVIMSSGSSEDFCCCILDKLDLVYAPTEISKVTM